MSPAWSGLDRVRLRTEAADSPYAPGEFEALRGALIAALERPPSP